MSWPIARVQREPEAFRIYIILLTTVVPLVGLTLGINEVVIDMYQRVETSYAASACFVQTSTDNRLHSHHQCFPRGVCF